MNVPELGRFELASRIALDEATGSWSVVGVESEADARLFAEELEFIVEDRVMMLDVSSQDALIEASRKNSDGLAIFFTTIGIEALHLDDVRSMLQRSHAAVLAIPPSQLSRLVTVAPHFASWVGNRVFAVQDDRFLQEDAREERLEALREHYGWTDDEFLAKVQRGALEPEPEHAEWLVLLERSDLLRSGS